MTFYLVVPLLLAVVILQSTIVPHLVVWGVFPNLPLLVVASWSLLRGAKQGAIWGFIAGAGVDLLSGAPFGASALSLIFVGLVSGLGEASIHRAHIVFPLIAAFTATIAGGLVFLAVLQVSGQAVPWMDSITRTVLPEALLSTVLMPVVYLCLRALSMRFGREEMEW